MRDQCSQKLYGGCAGAYCTRDCYSASLIGLELRPDTPVIDLPPCVPLPAPTRWMLAVAVVVSFAMLGVAAFVGSERDQRAYLEAKI